MGKEFISCGPPEGNEGREDRKTVHGQMPFPKRYSCQGKDIRPDVLIDENFHGAENSGLTVDTPDASCMDEFRNRLC